jgi:hypothetical protein
MSDVLSGYCDAALMLLQRLLRARSAMSKATVAGIQLVKSVLVHVAKVTSVSLGPQECAVLYTAAYSIYAAYSVRCGLLLLLVYCYYYHCLMILCIQLSLRWQGYMTTFFLVHNHTCTA